MTAKREVYVCEDRAALSREAAQLFIRACQESIESNGRFTVALAGGGTPRELYALLAEPFWSEQVEWARTHFFWGDERFVSPNHVESNFRMANETLLSKIPVPRANIHPVETETRSAKETAQLYDDTLREFFGMSGSDVHHTRDDTLTVQKSLPRFDLVLLGMGADGHTASLFPGSSALDEHKRLAVAVSNEASNVSRITFTLPVLSNAARVVFLVSGAEKASTLLTVLGEQESFDANPSRPLLPAQLVRPINGSLVWLTDKAAAHLLAKKLVDEEKR